MNINEIECAIGYFGQMIKGFKEFIMRGNVIDVSVGIAVGVAFTALVGAFGTTIINPLVAVAGGNNSERGLGFQILSGNPATYVDIGGLINAFIVFFITLVVVYFAIVYPMNAVRNRREKAEDEKVAEEIALLREIRDSLKK